LIDKFIRKTQEKAQNRFHVLEWIPYENIESLDKNKEFGTATWLNGPIKEWSNDEKKWIRYNEKWPISFKIIKNSKNLSEEFLEEV